MKILAIAPHPDDETLGCGGTLFKHKADGDEIYWLIVTGISEDAGWSNETVKKRDNEIDIVAEKYGFSNVFNLRLPTTKIDTLPVSNLIEEISNVYKKVEPGNVSIFVVGNRKLNTLEKPYFSATISISLSRFFTVSFDQPASSLIPVTMSQ
jgi:LmbE family N-acetylglucosaminyl deacetylase